MSIPPTLRTTCLTLTLFFAATLGGQTTTSRGIRSETWAQHLSSAQALHRAGKLSEAAEQYRAFLAGALSELATGYGLARDYQQAAPLFDEALTLQPASSPLLLAYAQTALELGDFAHAQTLATQVLRNQPGDRNETAEAHQLLGRTLLKLNRDQEARKELEAAVQLDPTFPNGYDLAVACLDLNDEKCAGQIFGEMEKSFGDTAEIHLAFGRAYAESDFQPRAVTEFRKAIEENPRLPGTHYLLAAVLMATGGDDTNVGDAEAELKKELALTPNDSMSYAALGKIASTHRDYAEAETYLKKAIATGSRNPDSYLYLGQVYFSTNRFVEAESVLRECIRLTTDVSRNRYQVQRAHFLLGRILTQKGQQQEAQKELSLSRELANKTLDRDKSALTGLADTPGLPVEQAIASASAAPVEGAKHSIDVGQRHKTEQLKEQLGPPVADSYDNLGAIAATNGDYAQAVTYFKNAFLWNPSLDGLDYNWGRAAFAGSLFTDAIPPLTRYVDSHGQDAGARSVLAISQFVTGNYSGCATVLDPVIGKSELAPEVAYVYAESLVKTGRVASGAQRLDALAKLHPEIADVHRGLGEALGQQGEKQRALVEFRTAIALSPKDADAHYDLGALELELGDAARAILELQAAADLAPTGEKYHEKLAAAYIAAHRPADATREMETYKLQQGRVPDAAPSPQGAPLNAHPTPKE